MPTPKTAIRLPRQLILELRGLAHMESLKQGRTVSWVELLTNLANRYVRRYGDNEVVQFGHTKGSESTACV